MITIFISTTTYAQTSESGEVTSKRLSPQRINTGIEKIDTRIASREATLRTKLQAFKDKRKAEIAERVNDNLNKINQNQTDQMKKHLEKMSTLLDKLEVRVNEASPDIKNITDAKTAIASARAIIATTSATINEQAEKDYTLQVTTESKIRAEAQSKRDLLHKDLQAARKIVINAKQSVSNAIQIARSGVNIKEGSNSATNR